MIIEEEEEYQRESLMSRGWTRNPGLREVRGRGWDEGESMSIKTRARFIAAMMEPPNAPSLP